MKKTVASLIAVAIVIVLLVFGAWYLQNSHKTYAGTPGSIRIGIPPLVDSSALVFIADDQHYFAENGLDVTIKEYATGSDAVGSLLSGNNDIAIATEFVMVKNAFKRENISGVGTMTKSENQYQIIGRVDRGIVREADLKGKRIGVPLGTAAEFYLGRFLELHGIKLRDVNLINVPPAQTVDAIDNGSVDAILIWKPFSDTIRDRLATNAVTWQAQSGQLGYWNAICAEDWMTRNPELINRFLKSMDEAAKYTIYHPAEARAIVQKGLPADKTYIDSAWPDTQFELSFDQSLITAMEDEGRWMINNNLTDVKTIPDYKDYLYLKGLEEVKPESVNIIS